MPVLRNNGRWWNSWLECTHRFIDVLTFWKSFKIHHLQISFLFQKWENYNGNKIPQNVLISVVYLSVPSVQFSRSVMFDYLQPHEVQHARPPSPSLAPGVYSDSRPSIRWCHPAISSSVIPFSSCPQSLPASESFPMSQLFSWGGQSKIK